MILLVTILLLAALILTTLSAALIGWKLGGHSKFIATLFAGSVCAVLVAGGVCAWHVSWLPEPFISRTACYLQGCWFTPFAAILFFIQARQAKLQAIATLQSESLGTETTRRQIVLLGVLTGVVL